MTIAAPKKTNPRADSFTLYMNFVGDAILRGLLPKKKWDKATSHKTQILELEEEESKKPRVTRVALGRNRVFKPVTRHKS